jgi:mannose-1-phosphate guanylyltransferase
MTLLGIAPDKVEEGYGWIEPEEPDGRYTLGVRRFWEKPPRSQAYTLWQQGVLWNTFVCGHRYGSLALGA